MLRAIPISLMNAKHLFLIGALALGGNSILADDDERKSRSLRDAPDRESRERESREREAREQRGGEREHAEGRESHERHGRGEQAEAREGGARRGHAEGRASQGRGRGGEHGEAAAMLRELQEGLEEARRAGKKDVAHEIEKKIIAYRRQIAHRMRERREQSHERDGDRGRENAEGGDRDKRREGESRGRRDSELEHAEKKLVEMMRELERAKRDGREDDARKIYNEINALKRAMHEGMQGIQRQGQGRGRPRNDEEIERRVMHLREAAENLKLAGKEREAQQVWQEAEQLARQHSNNRRHGSGPSNAELAEAVNNLQEEVRKLHHIIRGLQNRLNEKR